MKHKLTIALLAVAAAVSSCSEEYLTLAPESSTTPETLFKDATSAQYAVNGIAKLMQTQYWSTQGLNGEGTILLWMSEYPGLDANRPILTGWSNVMNYNYFDSPGSTYSGFGWYYYYKLIGNANIILENCPENTSREYDYVIAQALTFRAYSYFRLTQQYCRRWSDRKGKSRGVVLRLDSNLDPMPAASLEQVYAQIYADLDKAIELFTSCGIKRTNNWQPSLEVAHAIYSRAALYREDYPTCISHSQAARQDYPLMSYSDYSAGFYAPTKEWIWSAFQDATQNIYYYSFLAYVAANANTSINRNYPWVISRELYNKIPADDQRLGLIAAPTAEQEASLVNFDKENINISTGLTVTSSANLKKLQAAIDAATTESAKKKAQLNYDWAVLANTLNSQFKAQVGSRLYSTTKILPYMVTKFQVETGSSYGVGDVIMFRSAEMYYNEAEAQFAMGQESAARALLEAVVAPYQSNYSAASLSGTALRDEIRTYREFDLLQEGHSFFDAKRWGIDHIRKGWQEGGNFIANFRGELNGSTSGNFDKNGKNWWCYAFPNMETTYNPMVQKNETEDWTVGQ